MMRNIVEATWQCRPEDVCPGNADLATWLQQQARDDTKYVLLAHMDDGVIWGRISRTNVKLSREAFADVSPKLRWRTLQECRIFCQDAELFVWGDGQGGYAARWIEDDAADCAGWRYDEDQILWGDDLEATEPNPQDGFSLMREGSRGIRHAVPLEVEPVHLGIVGKTESSAGTPWHPLRLTVRNYLQPDDSGVLREIAGRCVKLFAVEPLEVPHD